MSLQQQYLAFLNSSSLWESEALFGLLQFDFKKLYQPTSDTIEIEIGKNEVLGKRIEHFFGYNITNSNHYEIIAHNLQVFKNKITIGELDFIINDLREEKKIHVELVYKFYLYDPNINNELERWIGPNRKDSLLQKIDKLKAKQLPLLYKKETSSILEKFQLQSQDIEQQVCFLANLFVPFSIKEAVLPYLKNDCIVGYWIKAKEFIAQKYGTHHFFIPQKKDWIVDPEHNDTWVSYEIILEQIQPSLIQKKSPLLWIKSSEDSYERFFIVWW